MKQKLMPGIYIQKIQAFLNLMTMKKERKILGNV